MFDSVLIANRGEIACRIIKTCRRLGVHTVALFSDADRPALHVAMADDAYRIGPAPARDSYLNAEAVIDIAVKAGADAIHPGYGFLSESAPFASACVQAGLTYIGPPANVIEAMADKINAKASMERVGIPVVPGFNETQSSNDALLAQAQRIGFPLLIKAVAGGGGKGMRQVGDSRALETAMASARREAAASFGDDRLFLEQHIPNARHIEVQIFADRQEHVIHLFERDCSVQRRYQKFLEESPARGLNEEQRQTLLASAVAAAKSIQYVGAGTVEFLVDRDRRHYFLEMNTRLQVEHPVTERVTGLDLVEWQMRVACGEALPLAQPDIRSEGHAIEVRLYAEDPRMGFVPSSGCLRRLGFPNRRPYLRIDTGMRQGDRLSLHYDALIAKLIVWGNTRNQALKRLIEALSDIQLSGVRTNLNLIRRLLKHPDFFTGGVDNAFVESHLDQLTEQAPSVPGPVYALAALYLLLHQKKDREREAQHSNDPYSPWSHVTGWWLNLEPNCRFKLCHGNETVAIRCLFQANGYRIQGPFGTMEAEGSLVASERLEAVLDGVRRRTAVVRQGHQITVFYAGQGYELSVADPLIHLRQDEAKADALVTPMPGKITDLAVMSGAKVRAGMPLLTLEAMKMVYTLVAPSDGVVSAMNYALGDWVEEGAELLRIEDAST